MRPKKLILTNLPYVLIGLACTNLGEAWRMAEGGDATEKILGLFGAIPTAFGNPLPSFNAFDLCVGLVCGLLLRFAVYMKGKNAKKYRHNIEYGAARFGTAEDIRPYIDPKFQNNIILTQTERLTMNSRPKNAKTARNKNVLIVGGSGSGKTRFFIKPNLMQLHSSYVVTDPKGQLVLETGRLLERAGYKISVLNTINFAKSMHYNPFAYIHSEKDILKLVTCLIANTTGSGQKGDEFWTNAEKLLYMALIGLLIATVVNCFVASSALYWGLTYLGVLIFAGLTAYDTQKIKQMLRMHGTEVSEGTMKVALLGSLTLYLDFVNLFLYLLRFFGVSRN